MDTVPDGRGQDDNPGNAQPRPDTHPLNSLYRGVSRISARGVLKVRPHTKSGGGGGGGGPAKAPSAPPPPPPPPVPTPLKRFTILTKRVLKHFANELICRF